MKIRSLKSEVRIKFYLLFSESVAELGESVGESEKMLSRYFVLLMMLQVNMPFKVRENLQSARLCQGASEIVSLNFVTTGLTFDTCFGLSPVFHFRNPLIAHNFI